MKFTCKNPECPSKGKTQRRILVISECSQELDVVTGDWGDIEPGDPVYGICGECSKRIPDKIFNQILESTNA